MTALIQGHGLGAAAPAELLLAGCSAGGRGVLTNLDAFAAAAPSNVVVKGFMDAALWVEVQPQIPDMLSLMNMTQLIYGETVLRRCDHTTPSPNLTLSA